MKDKKLFSTIPRSSEFEEKQRLADELTVTEMSLFKLYKPTMGQFLL